MVNTLNTLLMVSNVILWKMLMPKWPSCLIIDSFCIHHPNKIPLISSVNNFRFKYQFTIMNGKDIETLFMNDPQLNKKPGVCSIHEINKNKN